MNWIFGGAASDFAVLHLGGCLALAMVWLAPEAGWSAAAALAALAVIDTGHMCTTVLRTHFRGEEFRSRRAYWVVPLAVFAGATAWSALRLPYLFTVALYGTIYHHMRQYYGVTRWYERLNGRGCRPSGFYVQGLFALPVIALHWRPDGIDSVFVKGDLLVRPSPPLYQAAAGLYAVMLASWVVHEVRLWRSGIREPNRLVSILVPALLTAVGCFFGRSTLQVILPLVCTHGVAYFGIMGLSLRRLDPASYATAARAALVVVGLAAVAGGAITWMDEALIETEYLLEPAGLLNAALIGITLTPTVCHYVFDAWIWTGRHREAATVYGPAGAS